MLRALFRDARLANDVTPFLAQAFCAAISAHASASFGVRNSASMLLGALFTRTFGVKRERDDAARKNCSVTSRRFFSKFPQLRQFLLECLSTPSRYFVSPVIAFVVFLFFWWSLLSNVYYFPVLPVVASLSTLNSFRFFFSWVVSKQLQRVTSQSSTHLLWRKNIIIITSH